MALAHVGTGANAFGATSAAPAYPTGIVSNSALFLGVGVKLGSATLPTITDWTLIVNATLGGGADGAGTGTTRVGVYRKDVVTGSETGTVTVTPTGTVNVVGASITCWSHAVGQSITATLATGQQTTAVTAVSATASATLAETTNDTMVGWIVAAANTNLGSQTFTATGATYGTAVEHVDTGSTTGNDIRCAWISRPITAGTASAATVYTTTATAATTAGVGFLRLREAAAPVAAYMPTMMAPYRSA